MPRRPGRLDPTRTTRLQINLTGAVRQRLTTLRQTLWQTIARDDAFSLAERPSTVSAVFNNQFTFSTDAEKLTAFNEWVRKQIDDGVLEASGGNASDPWLAQYIGPAHKKGLVRTYGEAMAATGKTTGNDLFDAGARVQFLETAFGQPEQLAKVRMLATRAFQELNGITDDMARQLNRIMANGMAQGHGPYKVATEISQAIGGISKVRAKRLARTEIVRAHAEGQLDGMEALGIEGVTLEVEWQTAGDDRVCARCNAMAGKVYTLAEARGMIPLHPNCRCAWVPYFGDLGEEFD